MTGFYGIKVRCAEQGRVWTGEPCGHMTPREKSERRSVLRDASRRVLCQPRETCLMLA